jgi:MFS family permease
MIGILEGMAEATAGISKGYFGNLSDTLQKRVPFIRAGYGLSAISKPMMGILIAPLWIFAARVMDRVGKGLRTGARDAMLSDESARENKAKVFGFHRSLDTLGAAIGPLLAMLFLWLYPEQYRWLFILAFIPGLVAVALSFLLKDKPATLPVQRSSPSFFAFLSYWKKAPVAYRHLVIGLLAFMLFNSSDAFILLLIKDKGFSDTALIGFYVFYNVAYALLSYPAGVMADKIGMRVVLLAGLMFFAIVYGTLSFANSLGVLALVFFLYAMYAAAVEGISKALITNIAAEKDAATAIGFFTGFGSIVTLLSSTLAGILWIAFSPRAVFLFSACGVILVVIYFVIIFRKEKS